MKLIFVLAGLVLYRGSVAKLTEPVDLTWPFDETTLFFPGGQKFEFTYQWAGKDEEGIWYSTNDFTTSEHAGTHLDAPYHFNENGWKVADIPLDRLLVKGIFVNVSEQTGGNPNYTLPVSELESWVEKNGPLPDNCVVLVGFGWWKRWPDKELFLGPSDLDLRYPGLSPEAAEWLIDTGKVVGVGVDTASPDVSTTKDYAVHEKLTNKNIYILENVALTEKLPPCFNLIVMPMKITNGTGAPCRIVAKPLSEGIDYFGKEHEAVFQVPI